MLYPYRRTSDPWPISIGLLELKLLIICNLRTIYITFYNIIHVYIYIVVSLTLFVYYLIPSEAKKIIFLHNDGNLFIFLRQFFWSEIRSDLYDPRSEISVPVVRKRSERKSPTAGVENPRELDAPRSRARTDGRNAARAPAAIRRENADDKISKPKPKQNKTFREDTRRGAPTRTTSGYVCTPHALSTRASAEESR